MKSITLIILLCCIFLQGIHTSRLLQTAIGAGGARQLQARDITIIVASGKSSCINDNNCPLSEFCLNSFCTPKECVYNSDCFPDLHGIRVCINHQCRHQPCQLNLTCRNGYYCNNKSCKLILCSTNGDCKQNQYCNLFSHTCAAYSVDESLTLPMNVNLTDCKVDEDCGLGQFCYLKKNKCLHQECTSNNDCTRIATCNLQTRRCTKTDCFSSRDCHEGMNCLSNKCVITTPTGTRSVCYNNFDCSIMTNAICGLSNQCEPKPCNTDQDCPGFLWGCDQDFKLCQFRNPMTMFIF